MSTRPLGRGRARLWISWLAGFALSCARSNAGDDTEQSRAATTPAPTAAVAAAPAALRTAKAQAPSPEPPPPAQRPAQAPPATALPATAPSPAPPTPAAQAAEGAPKKQPPSPTVELRFRTVPADMETRVRHGRKRLGVIPELGELVVERPRDSGPLDVVLTSRGFLPVHTRAYTFGDAVVEVRMTPETERETLFGYKKPLPVPDAGVAGELSEGTR